MVEHPRFSLLQPHAPRQTGALFELERQGREPAALLQIPNAPVDLYNAKLPGSQQHLRRELGPLCGIPRMSTFAVAVLLNQAVAAMPKDASFVNVGVWNGFTFLSGIVSNPGRSCIGIDNFSQFQGPRDAFLERFERFCSDRHRFHEMDYREYFASVHQGPIGVYLYDGDHSYEDQLQGLEAAEPFLGDGSIVLVDDTNWDEPREATFEFVRRSKLEYELLLDERTASNAHPTLWNGLMVLRATGEKRREPARRPEGVTAAAPSQARVPASNMSEGARVSIVVHNDLDDPERLCAAVDAALGQRWDDLEVLVVDESGSSRCRQAVAKYGAAVTSVDPLPGPDGSGPARARDLSSGELVAFVSAGTPLRESAVRVGLGFPRQSQFFRPLDDATWTERERALAAADDIARWMPPGQRLALAADGTMVPRQLQQEQVLKFGLDDNGDEPAIEELERLRGLGAGAVAFLWGSFDWLEDHPRLHDRLKRRGTLLVENPRVKLFDIRDDA